MKAPNPMRILWVLGSLGCAALSFVGGHYLGANNAAEPTPGPRERVTGVGGIFFRAKDPGALKAWYEQKLGLPIQTAGEFSINAFAWREVGRPDDPVYTIWSPFPPDTEHFGPGGSQFMINYRVRDLDAMLKQLQTEGVPITGTPMDSFNGRFAWITDPEGRRVELWQPAKGF